MKTPSFRLKIALLSAAISGVVLVGFGVAAFLMVSRQKTASMDAEIRTLASRHPGWITNRQNFDRLDEMLDFIYGDTRDAGVILMVKDLAGEWLHISSGWPDGLDPAALDCNLEDDPDVEVETTERGGPGYRGGWGRGGGVGGGRGPGAGAGGNATATAVFTKIPEFRTVALAAGTWRMGVFGTEDDALVIGLNASQANAELKHLRDLFLLAMPGALFLVGLGGWVVAGRALRPLRVIAGTAEQVTARGLDQRIPVSDEDPEINRLILVLNRMMDRLEGSFRQATRFSADASHELKTPLAIMQGELENALQEAAPGSPGQQVFSNLLEETQRLKTITRGLLLLARADAGQLKPALENVDVGELLENLVEDARVLAAETRLEIDTNLAAGLHVMADPGLLHTALMNLLVNAVKYNEPDGRIRIDLRMAGQHVELEIGNTGPGIPAAHQAQIFDRFQRVDTARGREVEGVGLGLSLASEIVRAHGGELGLAESAPGWTRFVLRLPGKG